jgi:transposase
LNYFSKSDPDALNKEHIMGRFDLSDEEWSIIEPHFSKAGRGPARQDDRRILNGIFYILRTGAPWRDLPERYGPRTTVYNRYNRWGSVAFGRASLMRSPKNEKIV